MVPQVKNCTEQATRDFPRGFFDIDKHGTLIIHKGEIYNLGRAGKSI